MGDLVVVYPGEMIPVDGEIIEGLATIDQKTITGEGLPVTRGKGEAAFAATVIREGQLTLRAIARRDGHHGGPDRPPGGSPRRWATPACKTTPSCSPTAW